MPEQPIRPAATLVLARSAGTGVEVFLSRRTSKAAFMANAYVYPGGRVDSEDAAPELAERVLPREPEWFAARFEDALPADDVRAHHVAALRESFEEAGVLLARRADGSPLDLANPDVAARLVAHRAALNRHEVALLDVLRAEDLVLDASALDYFAHWITPPFESRRFDTRFFFAVLPEGQEPIPDYAELVDGGWFAPSEALAAYARGEIQLAPPTFCTLDDLAAAGPLDRVRAWADACVPVPIQPRLHQENDEMLLLLPGDPLYPLEPAVRGPTRLAIRDGRFVAR